MPDCRVCGGKDTQFYKGVTSRCKECHKAGARAAREMRIEHYREYDRLRADNPERVAIRKQVAAKRQEDPLLREKDAKHGKAWQERNRTKRAAHNIVNNAIRDGKLIPVPCELCLSEDGVQAHHEDYDKPLDVMWLCQRCHGLRHREINAERRRAATTAKPSPSTAASRPHT